MFSLLCFQALSLSILISCSDFQEKGSHWSASTSSSFFQQSFCTWQTHLPLAGLLTVHTKLEVHTNPAGFGQRVSVMQKMVILAESWGWLHHQDWDPSFPHRGNLGMAGTLTGLLTAAREDCMKEWNLVGRSFRRGIPV